MANASGVCNTNVQPSHGLKAADIQHLLRQRIAVLSGGRDKNGRPLITCPSRENAEKTSLDDLRLVLLYLHAIPSDETKECGFVVLIDMRHGMTWNAVKPILKTLQEHFPGFINAVYIIKPDRFWEKHKASIASAKYKFEVNMISVENLHKYIDSGQLTMEFDGTLVYDHEEWLELRIALEDLIWRCLDVLRVFDGMREELEDSQMPVDVETARTALENHTLLRKRIGKAPVEQLEQEGQQLVHRLTGAGGEDGSVGGADSDYGSAGRDSQVNPDFSTAAPNILSLLENLRTTRQNLYTLWQNRKVKLDQCFQLQLFQQDAEKMFQWIRDSIECFLSSYANIGDSHETAQNIQQEHENFSLNAMNTYVNISHIMTVAQRLVEGGHYAAPRIQAAANRLDRDWKVFAKSLDLRAAVLTLSVNFHYKAKQYLSNVDVWVDKVCGRDCAVIPCTVTELEQAIHQHQQLVDAITQAYSEIHMTSKNLLYQLDHLVQLCLGSDDEETEPDSQTSEDSGTREGKALVHALKHPPSLGGDGEDSGSSSFPLSTTPDYTSGANHVLAVIHNLVARQRQLEQAGQQRRVQLHQRLALVLFQQDVKQVLDWLDNHGENFLRKNVGIGKTLQRARALQKSQQHFENVAKNTYANAEKLLTAAEDLAGTGECQPEEVYGVAQELQRRISAFAKQVQSRRHLLNLSVLFHTHYREMLSWYEEVEREDAEAEIIGSNLNDCERKQDAWLSRTDATLQAYATVIQEGQQLAGLLRQQAATEDADNGESIKCAEVMLGEIEKRQTQLAERWQTQRLALQLGAKFCLFKEDCVTVSGQLNGWMDDMRQMIANLTPAQAEKCSPLHQENTAKVHSAMLEIMSLAQEQIQVLDTSGLHLKTPDGRLVLDSILSMAESVRNHEKEIMNLAEDTQTRLEQALALGRLQSLAAQVVGWINNEERMLSATLALPSSWADAEQLLAEHKEFQVAVKRTNQSALALQEKAEAMLASNHYDPTSVRGVAEDVLGKWRRLVGLTEERNKLLTAAVTYYKTLEQVLPVLDNLESDYEQARDWCALFSRQASSDPQMARATDKVSFMSFQLSKHMDNKDRFLRGCTYARKNSELLLKFVRRCGTGNAGVEQTEGGILDRLEQLRQRENQILQLWTKRKRQLDQCQQFVLLEASAKQVLDWLHQEGEVYLSTHADFGRAREQVEKLLDEHLQFKANAKEQREKVRLFLGLASGIVAQEASHIHATDIQQWITTVQQRYTDFSQRMEKLERRLQTALGRQEPASTRDLALDRQSDPSLEAKIKDAAKQFSEARRKSTRQKDYIMAEMLQTERVYVNDLKTCIDIYLEGMRKSENIPACLKGMEEEIFCNLEEICAFHRDVFLTELEKYETLPEDVGHCFVTWVQKFQMHVLYCKNHSRSNHLICHPEALQFFAGIQQRSNLSMPLQAYLIKPVQRITKYQLLLKDLCTCCDEAGEVGEALEVMLNVPKRANDIIHLSLLDGCSEVEMLGDVLMQDSFQVWDPKQLIKKGRERQVFLFELSIVFSKKVLDTQHQGKSRYAYKYRLMLSEINVTEHIEGDECKFGLWTGSVPNNEYRTILRAPDHKAKVAWVKKIREIIQQRVLHLDLPRLPPAKSLRVVVPGKDADTLSQTTESSAEVGGPRSGAADRVSIHSFASTVSSETEWGKSHGELSVVLENFSASAEPSGQISVARSEQVEVIERSVSYPDWFLIRATETPSDGASVCREGIVPVRILGNLESETETEAAMMKRKSFKKWFTPTSAAPGNSKQHKFGGQRQFSADSAPTTPTETQEQLQRKGGSVYSKFKLSDRGAGVSEENRPVTPPLASEEDLQDSERLSSAKQTPLTDNPVSLVLSEECGPAEESSLPQDIEIPPPMESLASDKLMMNGQQEPSSPSSKASEVTVTPGGGEGMSEGLEAMVRLQMEESGDGDVGNEESQPSPTEPESKSPEEQAKEKRRYVLMEMAETERDYVRDLGLVVDGYINTWNNMANNSELPDGFAGKDQFVFHNIQQIHEFHRTTFQGEIEKCLEDYEASGRAFTKYERRLSHIYVKYCQNKPKSEFLIQQEMEAFFIEIKQKLGHKLSIADLLIKPVQRIMKYQLLLKDILKYTERAGDDTREMKKALDVMHKIPKECDAMMQVGRLQGFNGNITAQGKLLAQGTLLVSDNPPSQVFKGKERRLIVFEQSLIIADVTGPKKEFSNPYYVYKSHIMVNKLAMEPDVPDEPLRFIIKSNDPSAQQEFLLQVASMQEKDEWMTKLNGLLDFQNSFIKALANPRVHQENLTTKESGGKKGKEDKNKSKSPIMNRLTQLKSKDSSGGSSSLGAQDSGEPRKKSLPTTTQQAASPKNRKGGIFDNFRNPLKSKTGLGVKSPGSPPPGKRAVIVYKYSAVRSDELSVKRGEQVELLQQDGSRCLVTVKESRKTGWVPNYLLEPVFDAADSLADKIELRRHFYQRLGSTPVSVLSTNATSLLENVCHIPRLSSFVRSQSKSPSRPIGKTVNNQGHLKSESKLRTERVQFPKPK